MLLQNDLACCNFFPLAEQEVWTATILTGCIITKLGVMLGLVIPVSSSLTAAALGQPWCLPNFPFLILPLFSRIRKCL